MNVVLLQNHDDEAMWDHFVLGHPQASGYHTLAWRMVVSKVFGHRTYYLMARDEGGVVQGVLPLVLTKSPMFG
ncbi:MAG: FemAB-like protein, partial [Nitrospirota bacterium]